MRIELAKISEGGSTYTGELPAEAMDLAGDRFIRPGGPIEYELTATIVSDQIIVTGWMETTLELLCVACAEFFSTSIRISSFLHAYPLQAGQETLDLTADIREDILLAVPLYPRGHVDDQERCMACGRDVRQLPRLAGEETPPPDCWGPLDNLKM